jgi:hypothetical protein
MVEPERAILFWVPWVDAMIDQGVVCFFLNTQEPVLGIQNENGFIPISFWFLPTDARRLPHPSHSFLIDIEIPL